MKPLLRVGQQRIQPYYVCSSCLARSRHLPAIRSILQNRPRNTTTSHNDRRRSFHSTACTSDELDPRAQAQPVGDFYTELLAKPIPKRSDAQSSLPTFVQSGDESKEERARKLFGNIRGSGYERKLPEQPDVTWKTINGVPVPPRPTEPDNCCMSGCAHCVWDDYRDDVESWAARLHQAQSNASSRGREGSPKVNMHRAEVADASGSMDDDGGGSESLWQSPSPAAADEGDVLFQGIPVGIREFMATEKRIRDRQKARTKKTK